MGCCVDTTGERWYAPLRKFCLDFHLTIADVVRVLGGDARTLYRGYDDFAVGI